MSHVYCRLVRELALAGLPALIQEAVTSIRFHLDQPLRLHQITQALSVHPSYLCRAFKKALGMTLTEYITTCRIEEAKYLLEHEDVSVTQAALSVGYTDPNYFSKVFTKLEHMIPQAYRKPSNNVVRVRSGGSCPPGASDSRKDNAAYELTYPLP